VINEVPALLASRISADLLLGVIADMADPLAMPRVHLGWAVEEQSEGSEPRFSSVFANRMKLLAATLACKAAVKAGQPLSQSQRTALIREILARWSSLSCPHGRPTVLRLGPGELERMFLRS
jgi:DNA mismatch repair protein MutL